MQIITDEFRKEKKEHGNYYFPFLLSYEKISKYEAGEFLWHWHPEIELTFILSGEMIYKVNGESFHIGQGQALFGNSSILHSGCMYQDKECEYVSLTFDTKLLYGYENSIIYTKYIEPIVQNAGVSAIYFDLTQEWHEAVITILKDIINIHAKKGKTYEMDIVMKLEQFWKLLIVNNAEQSINTLLDKRNYERLKSIISYVEENYASSLSLKDIAEAVHLCKSECSRMFKKYMKVSLFAFISQYRIEKSVYYLTNTSLSVSEIAIRVGFNDPDYFSKVFHRQKGCPPLKYRQNKLCYAEAMLIE